MSSKSGSSELDLRMAVTRPERLATWAGAHVDGWVRRALRALFLRNGMPYLSEAELEQNLSMLACYCDLEASEALFEIPYRVPTLKVHGRRPVLGGMQAHFSFPSPYLPIHPLYASEFRRYDRLETVHLFAWQHARPAPVSLLVTHGWGLGSKRLHALEFGIDFLFRELGLDVYYYVAPFHWIRKPKLAKFSGELHPSPNLMRTNEAFIQTVVELRSAIGVIKRHNDAPLGMMGSSLGGYTTALLASVDDRLDYAVPVLPPGSLADLFWEHGDGDRFRAQVESMGMTLEHLRHAWSLHSPMSYEPKVPWKGRMLVSAVGDRLVTDKHVDMLWEHWGRPRRHRFAGGHILQVYRGRYQRALARLLADLDYIPASRLARIGLTTLQ